MLAAFYGIMSLMFIPFMLGFMALGSFAAKAQASGHGGPSPLPLMLGMGAGFIIVLPFLYAAMGFVFGVLAAVVYNLLASWIGGLGLEFEAAEPAAAPLPPVNPVQS